MRSYGVMKDVRTVFRTKLMKPKHPDHRRRFLKAPKDEMERNREDDFPAFSFTNAI